MEIHTWGRRTVYINFVAKPDGEEVELVMPGRMDIRMHTRFVVCADVCVL
jgi:hypothetical protein